MLMITSRRTLQIVNHVKGKTRLIKKCYQSISRRAYCYMMGIKSNYNLAYRQYFGYKQSTQLRWQQQEVMDSMTKEVFPFAAIIYCPALTSCTTTSLIIPATPLPQYIECRDLEDLINWASLSNFYDPLYDKVIAYIEDIYLYFI